MANPIIITEGHDIGLADCNRLWDALPHDFQWDYADDERARQARYFGLKITAERRTPLTPGFFVGISNLPGVSDTFFVWPEEPPVSVPDAERVRPFSPLLIIVFLQVLDGLCRRHLRRNYIRVVENLHGQAKGRIRISEHLHQNVARQRQDRVVCEYGRFDDDCLENRILRAALEVGAAYLAGKHATLAHEPIVRSWIAGCRAALANVKVVGVTPMQFLSVRSTGNFRHYKWPHRLARAVLQHLGIDPQNLNRQSVDMRVPPFALCTYELFERYAEAALRKVHCNLWVGYNEKKNNLPGGRYSVRPDFIETENGIVIDCKYKSYPQDGVDERERADVYQVVAYSRHQGVLDCIGGPQGRKAPEKLVLLYPEVVQDESLWGQTRGSGVPDGSFEIPLVRARLYCPELPT